MKDYLISNTLRLFFAVSASIISLGIWLTGVDQVHWLLYVPPAFFYFAAITRLCPGLILSRLITGDSTR